MASKSAFVEYLLDQLRQVDGVRARAMFGGHGIYRHDLMFGLVADDVLYLKVDARNKDAFIEAGSGPFVYEANGRRMEMSYFACPEGALDDPDELARWAGSAMDAALRTVGAKSKPKPKSPARQASSAKNRTHNQHPDGSKS
ncbi:MAG: TfoX/Sxy family protein [Deltaproteobacteria bacterium]|nr:TfoX/Sxy family protein [Deltaproteobacteria bacterium]